MVSLPPHFQSIVLPDYFGKNLDALFDCLCSLEVVGKQDIVLLIRHADAFLEKEKAEKSAARPFSMFCAMLKKRKTALMGCVSASLVSDKRTFNGHYWQSRLKFHFITIIKPWLPTFSIFAPTSSKTSKMLVFEFG